MIEKRILIVDDDKTVLFAYKKLFQFAGVKVDTAKNIAQAKEHMSSNEYRAVVTDLRLSADNPVEGLHVLENMKELNPETRLILITGFGSPAVKAKATEMGVDFYFEKPVPIDNLIKILQSVTK